MSAAWEKASQMLSLYHFWLAVTGVALQTLQSS